MHTDDTYIEARRDYLRHSIEDNTY